MEPGVLLGARRAPVGLPLVCGLPRPVCEGALGVDVRHYEAPPLPRYHDLHERLRQETGLVSAGEDLTLSPENLTLEVPLAPLEAAATRGGTDEEAIAEVMSAYTAISRQPG